MRKGMTLEELGDLIKSEDIKKSSNKKKISDYFSREKNRKNPRYM